MRRLWVVVMCCCLVGLGAGAGSASPTLLGPTGLLLVPTADTLGTLEFNLGASALLIDEAPDVTAVYGNVCVLPRLEIGATLLDPEFSDSETVLNAKYRIMGLPGEVTIAAGVFDVTDEVDQSIYAVLSHDLGAGIIKPKGIISNPRVHVGIGGGQFDGLFGGVSLQVGQKTDVIAEYDTDDINLGLKYALLPKVNVTAAAIGGFDEVALGASIANPW